MKGIFKIGRYASGVSRNIKSANAVYSNISHVMRTFSVSEKQPAPTKYVKLAPNQKIVMLGFGAIGQGSLPLLFRHIDMKPSQFVIMSDQWTEEQLKYASSYGVSTVKAKLVKNDYKNALESLLKEGDFLINVSVDVSSMALVEVCQKVGALYMDTCNEPWAGGYSDPNATASERSNYAFREEFLSFRSKIKPGGPTALMTHGANPGLVSHFVKEALLNIAKDTNYSISKTPTNREEWGALAKALGIKTIHIAERDTQASPVLKGEDEFVNTWSIEGYVEEGKQPAELSWGTHEKEWPLDARRHGFGCDAGIYLDRPGALTRVRTWTPKSGPYHGLLITHTEAISIADYFTVKKADGSVDYRPTVHFAYHASNDAMQSMAEMAGKEWVKHPRERIMVDEITTGRDELGVLLMGHKKGAYWFGSNLSIEQARALVPRNNATSLQVCVGVLTGTVFAFENPRRGLVEPEEIEHQRILEVGAPYLGDFRGHYSDWTPLKDRNKLFKEDLDTTDPWQFKNFRVL